MEWLQPWAPILDPITARAMETELTRELSIAHPLFGVPVSAIGLGWSGDDVLFRLLDGSGRLAAAHLTWGIRSETPPFPFTTLFENEADWISRGMKSDHNEYFS